MKVLLVTDETHAMFAHALKGDLERVDQGYQVSVAGIPRGSLRKGAWTSAYDVIVALRWQDMPWLFRHFKRGAGVLFLDAPVQDVEHFEWALSYAACLMTGYAVSDWHIALQGLRNEA